MVQQFSIEAFIFIFILIIYILTAHLIQVQKIPFLHQSTVAIIMGFLTALFVYYGFDGKIQFDNQIFFTIILPPIIFSAGYSLRKSLFFQNFGMITFLGVIGTIIGFICLCLFCLLINTYIFKELSLKEIMLLSSVLCATDTVAAMSLIKPDKFPVLNAVLFGQGIINDAVAIVLFRTIANLNIEDDGFSFNTVMYMIIDFLILTVVSLAIGAFFGFGISYLLKVNESFNRYPIKETSLILLVGYIAYLVGQILGFSGIITLFTCAIIMGHYTFMNISQEAQRGTGLAFQTISYIAQAFVYAYLGATILGINGNWLAVAFAILVLLLLPFIRALMVYLLPAIYHCKKKTFPLNDRQLKVCWYSGLVRGVIAFALALQIQSQNEDFIITIVLIVVLLTTIVGSSLLKTFCEWIGLKSNADILNINESKYSNMSKSLIQESDYKGIDFGLDAGNITQSDNQSKKSMKEKLQSFQSTYMKPIFQKNPNQDFNYEIQIPNRVQKDSSSLNNDKL